MDFKKVFFILLMLTTIVLSCEKEKDDYKSTATITGPDVRDCICCSGYFIDIGDSTFNFNTLPVSSNIDLTTETFPLPVKLDWTYNNKCGNIQYINISRIVKE